MNFASLNIENIFLFVYSVLTGQGNAGVNELHISRDLILFWDSVKVFSTIVSLLLLTFIVYIYIRLYQTRKEEREELERMSGGPVSKEALSEEVAPPKDPRWERVLAHAQSENQNDWKQAIIEADTILEDIINRSGYPGETLGEKMRGIEKSDLTTINEAWEAHKVRNRIAHEGSQFDLTKRETLRVIDLYRQVFQESQII